MGLLSCFIGLYVQFVNIFKRLLCFLHIKRRRKNSGSILPLHTDLKNAEGVEALTSLPTNDVTMTSWDSWGDEGNNGFRSNGSSGYQQQELTAAPAASGGMSAAGSGRFYNHKKQLTPTETEPETDYFQELNLEPSIRRTQKIYIRKKEENNIGISSRLAMTSDIPILEGELGMLDDNESGGWADEASEDLSNEALLTLRETRRNERVSRAAQQHHEKLRGLSTKKDKLSAVKLS